MKTNKGFNLFMVFWLGFAIVGCSQKPIVKPAQTATLAPTILANSTPTFFVNLTPTHTQTPTLEAITFEGRIMIAGLSRQHSEIRLFNLGTGEIQDVPGFGFGSVSWSPDYQRIAFTGGAYLASHTTAIYVSKPDGSDLQKYADSIFWKTDLSWSPDGKFLVFRYGNFNEAANLAILNLVNGETYLLTDKGYLSNPAWSPDGKQIAFINQFQLWIMNADSSNSKQLIDLRLTATDIDWSPDGNWLAFVSGEKYGVCGDIYIRHYPK